MKPPPRSALPAQPQFQGATRIKLDAVAARPVDGKVRLQVDLQLPEGWKINKLAPARYWLQAKGDQGPLDRSARSLNAHGRQVRDLAVAAIAQQRSSDRSESRIVRPLTIVSGAP